MTIDITKPFDYRQCPKCGNIHTHWRSGVHFDHERICSRCDHDWDPDEEYQKYLQAERKRREQCTDRD